MVERLRDDAGVDNFSSNAATQVRLLRLLGRAPWARCLPTRSTWCNHEIGAVHRDTQLLSLDAGWKANLKLGAAADHVAAGNITEIHLYRERPRPHGSEVDGARFIGNDDKVCPFPDETPGAANLFDVATPHHA